MSDDLSPEDAALLAQWSAGPGAFPTAADGQRMLQQVRDGVWPCKVSRPRQRQCKQEYRRDDS